MIEGSGTSNSMRIAGAKEVINKRQSQEVKKIKENFDNEIDKVRTDKEKEISKFKKEYDFKMGAEKAEAEMKLTKLRNQYAKQIQLETERFKKLMDDLKQTNSSRLLDAQKNHEVQFSRQESKFKDYLEKARIKFEEEKQKLEV